LVFGLLACEQRVPFQVVNETDFLLDSINISPSEGHNAPYLQLRAGERQTYWLDKAAFPVADGHYILTYSAPFAAAIPFHFGYFSNGNALEEDTEVIIKKDTVLIRFAVDRLINN
jgi:hypothetical protein